jgi:4-oxalocrotonate tautomerase
VAVRRRASLNTSEVCVVPFVRIDWFPGRTLDQKREVMEVLTRELSRIARCRPETINVIFTEVEREDWGRNGKLFCDAYEYENVEDENVPTGGAAAG